MLPLEGQRKRVMVVWRVSLSFSLSLSRRGGVVEKVTTLSGN